MSRRVILSPDAKENIRSAIRWYLNEQVDLVFRFKAETKATLARVARNPYQFPIVDNPIRRALMKRFRYAIYFTLIPDAVFVVAVLHQRRVNPRRRP